MYNFKFKGLYKKENSINHNELPENMVKLKECGSLLKLNIISLLIALFIFIINFLLFFYKFFMGKIQIDKVSSSSLIIIFCASILTGTITCFISICLLYDKEAEKEVWFSLKYLTILLFCSQAISKLKFINTVLSSILSLSIIPYILCLYGVFDFNFYILVFVMFTSSVNFISNIGMLLKLVCVMKQVPDNAMIRNYGKDTYWYIVK